MRDTSALAEEINSARHRLVRSGSTRRSIQWRVTRSGYRLPAGGQMLRRINAALFEAPAGARIEIVAESQNNNGVTDARFEYDGALLDREQILGLPGCSFTVAETHARLQAVVAFADSAPGTARYDLSEVENGVLSNLNKFTLKSDASPLIDFVIDPVE